MKPEAPPLPAQTSDVVALALAVAAGALLLLGDRAAGAAVGALALSVLAVGSWRRARQLQATVDALRSELEPLHAALERAQPLATAGLAAAGLAHEMKNSLMVIGGFASLAKAATSDASARAHLVTVESETSALVERVHSFVRLASPAPEPQRRPLGEILDETIRLIAPVARLRDIAFVHDVEQVRTLTLPVQDPAFRAALLDLLLNALDHARTEVRLSAELARPTLRLRVSDDGAGVPEELRATLFVPFSTARAGGLGLGLSRAREAVNAENGTLEHVSDGSPGATFILTLPAPEPVVKSSS